MSRFINSFGLFCGIFQCGLGWKREFELVAPTPVGVVANSGNDLLWANKQHAAAATVGCRTDTDLQNSLFKTVLPSVILVPNAVRMVQVSMDVQLDIRVLREQGAHLLGLF